MKYYITEEGLQDLKKRILQLEARREFMLHSSHAELYHNNVGYLAQLGLLNNILDNSVILPEYNSWEDVELYPPDNEGQNDKTLRDINGVIIKTK